VVFAYIFNIVQHHGRSEQLRGASGREDNNVLRGGLATSCRWPDELARRDRSGAVCNSVEREFWPIFSDPGEGVEH